MRRDGDDPDSRGMKRNRTLVISALLASLGPLVGNGLWAGPGTDGDEILADARDGLPTIAYVASRSSCSASPRSPYSSPGSWSFLFERAPVAAVTTGIAGTAMLAVKVGSAAPMDGRQLHARQARPRHGGGADLDERPVVRRLGLPDVPRVPGRRSRAARDRVPALAQLVGGNRRRRRSRRRHRRDPAPGQLRADPVPALPRLDDRRRHRDGDAARRWRARRLRQNGLTHQVAATE